MSSSLSTFGVTNQTFEDLEVLGDGHIFGDLDVNGTVTAEGPLLQALVCLMDPQVVLP